jgi:hypothetical protein
MLQFKQVIKLRLPMQKGLDRVHDMNWPFGQGLQKPEQRFAAGVCPVEQDALIAELRVWVIRDIGNQNDSQVPVPKSGGEISHTARKVLRKK